ncbi:MAG: HAMP domain-containing histidine kinase [Bacteroidetes bacterium]|nr:HAMP domain-containing histidine kinase [Bacteroidota bacterium]
MINITRSGRLKVQNSEIDFKSVLNESLHNLRNLEGAHKLKVSFTIEGIIPYFNDQKQLLVLFNNIISNSIKFQHSHEMNPQMAIGIQVGATEALMSFKDNGIGIAKENLNKVFDMFFKTPGTKADGSGLGLYIVREVVKKLKGKVSVESKINEGSTFVIHLPNKIDPDLLRKFSKLVQI